MTNLDAILHHIPPALLVVFRIGGLMMYGPVFGSTAIPIKVKVFLSFLIGFAAYPLLSTQCFAGLQLKLEIWSLAPLVAMELLIGLVIGYIASLPMIAMQIAGLIMGQQIGLGFAQLYNPALDDEADIIGQLLFFMALAGFLAIGGHESIILAVLHSFEHIRLGGFAADQGLLDMVCGMLLSSLELALRVVAPLMALVFLETVAMGFLSKTVPQLNIMSFGFPIRILIGLGVVAVGLVVINDVAMDGVDNTMNTIFQWVDGSENESTPDDFITSPVKAD